VASAASITELIVYAPGLLGPYAGQEQWQAADWPALGQFQKLLSRADSIKNDHATRDDNAACFSYFNVDATQQALPLAAVSLLAEGRSPGNDYWLRLDPVCLLVDRDDAILIAHEELALTAEEATALQAAIRPLLDEWSVSLQGTTSHHWYLRLPRPIALTTTSPAQVRGFTISRHLPQGEDAMQWHRLMNEVQMTWYSHPVNQQREAQGQLTASSVWPWGGGVLPVKNDVNYTAVYSDDLMVKGLAILHEIACRPLAAAVPSEMQGRVLVVDLSWRERQQQQDALAWFEALLQWQNNVLQPIVAQLEANSSLRVTFDFGSQHTYVVNRQHLHRWWRRTKSLQQLISSTA